MSLMKTSKYFYKSVIIYDLYYIGKFDLFFNLITGLYLIINIKTIYC